MQTLEGDTEFGLGQVELEGTLTEWMMLHKGKIYKSREIETVESKNEEEDFSRKEVILKDRPLGRRRILERKLKKNILASERRTWVELSAKRYCQYCHSKRPQISNN